MPQTQNISKIEALLEKRLCGDPDSGAVDAEDPARFHPDAVTFYYDDPQTGFKGLAKEPIFEANLLFGEMDDDRKFRLERQDCVLVYTRYESSSSQGCLNASGQAIVCDKDSDAESVFLLNALSDMTEAAAEPLIGLLESAREAGLQLSPAVRASLVERLFGTGTN